MCRNPMWNTWVLIFTCGFDTSHANRMWNTWIFYVVKTYTSPSTISMTQSIYIIAAIVVNTTWQVVFIFVFESGALLHWCTLPRTSVPTRPLPWKWCSNIAECRWITRKARRMRQSMMRSFSAGWRSYNRKLEVRIIVYICVESNKFEP